MKNLFSIVTIIFLSIFISCSNNEKSVIESSNLNALDSIKAIIEDSILFEKRRIEDSIKLEVRKAILKDSLENDSIKKVETAQYQLMTSNFDSLYNLWKDKRLKEIAKLAKDTLVDASNYKAKRKIQKIKSTIELVNSIITLEKNVKNNKTTAVKDTIQELKDLIIKLSKTPKEQWIEKGLVHPIMDYGVYGAHDDSPSQLRREFGSDYFKKLASFFKHPKFEKAIHISKNGGAFNVVGFGMEPRPLHYSKPGYKLAFLIFGNQSLPAIDSLYQSSKDLEKIKENLENTRDYHDYVLMNIELVGDLVSNTNPLKLAHFIISRDMKNTDFSLFDGKAHTLLVGGEHIDIREIKFGKHNDLGPTFNRIDGKLYFTDVNYMNQMYGSEEMFNEDSEEFFLKRNYQLPKPLDDNGITYKTILKRIKEEGWGKPVGGTGGGWSEWLYKETFRPIGWSKDGKFAFIINGAGEVEYLKLIIVNSKTNKIICKIKEVDYELNNFWNNNYGKIEKVLTENKIIQQYDFQLDIESPPQIKLKDHPVEKRTLKVLKGSIGILQNPFESNAVTIDYYFWHEGARGEGGTEFDVTGINTK